MNINYQDDNGHKKNIQATLPFQRQCKNDICIICNIQFKEYDKWQTASSKPDYAFHFY